MLVGGARTEALRPLVDRFAELAAAHRAERASDRPPRIAVVVAAARPGSVLAEAERMLGGRFELVPLVARLDADGRGEVELGFDGHELLDVDGVVVADGPAGALVAALDHRAGDLRRRVHEGMPYFGVGAGAAIAADRALLGGHEIGGVAVAPETTDPGDPELRLGPGLGLVDLAIVPHAAQHGRVGLAVAAIEAELVDRVVAVDDDTALEVGADGLRILGAGSVWQCTGADSGVVVASARADAA